LIALVIFYMQISGLTVEDKPEVILLLETDSAHAFKASERIRTAIETTPLEVSGEKVFITISIGIAGFPEHGKELQEIITGADKSLYKSKEKGRNRASIFQMVV
jgi:diguanylate cyclase (GGDEF)-like protein